MTAYMDIEVPRNASCRIRYQMVDDSGQPIDLTGSSLRLSVRRSAGEGGAPIASATIVIEQGNQGFWEETFTGSDFDEIGGQYEIVRLVYDLKRIESGFETIERRGQIILIPGATYG